MLVLSRKVGQKIVVPEYRLTITVVCLEGNRVRLGLQAPANVRIDREEVWLRNAARAAAEAGELVEMAVSGP